MFHCAKCGKQVSAMEAVVHEGETPLAENMILCPACFEALNQSKKRSERTKRRVFWFAVLLALGLLILWLVLFIFTASPWEVYAVFAGWLMGIYFSRQAQLSKDKRMWWAVWFTFWIILLREWLMLSIVVGNAMGEGAPPINLPPLNYVWQAFVVQISANPMLVVFWLISLAISALAANRTK